MNPEDYLNDALLIVSSWDLPDDEFIEAVNDQARLMAGIDFDSSWGFHVETPHSSLY